MLSNAFEWERLVNPSPTDEMVARRKAIVGSVLGSFDEQEDVKSVFQLVSAALTGLSPAIAADVAFAKILTEATKAHHEAFPSSLAENALDLQLTACLTVGDLLTRKATKQAWTESRTAVAGVCVSTAGLTPRAAGLHLKTVQETLISASRDCLARNARTLRERPEYDSSELEELSPSGDAAAIWGQLKPVLMSAFDSITRASAIDRDELEVLWWLYNEMSLTFSKALSVMPAYEVAFAAPIELVDRALCPAPASLINIILGHVARASNKPSSGGKQLKSVIGTWTPEVIASLLPNEASERKLVVSCPKVLPLTWIAGKVADAGVTSGWEQEFASRSGLRREP
ncbi:MAG: GTPase-associated system all-helical protein GASH [Planctomycetaceae bacterium]